MRVRSLVLRAFTSHSNTRVVFPPTGIVVVTGRNGAGKSSLVEGVAVAGWGKTLRGTPPWNEAIAAFERAAVGADSHHTHLEADGIEILRSRKRSKTALFWKLVDDGSTTGCALDATHRLSDGPGGGAADSDADRPATAFENTSKAQEALDRVIGSFDVWRRSSTFSVSDAAHFSLATDSERKRFLEGVIGIDCFDDALDQCRADMREIVRNLHEARRGLEVARTKHENDKLNLVRARERLSRAKESMPEEVPMPNEVGLKTLRENVTKGSAMLRDLKSALTAAEREAFATKLDRDAASSEVARLAKERCPVCDQAVPPARLESAKGRLARASTDAGLASTKAEEVRAALADEIAEVEMTLVELAKRVGEEMARIEKAKERAVSWRRAKQVETESAYDVAEAERRLGELDVGIVVLSENLARLEKAFATQSAVENVLGLRGFRAMVLSKSLEGINLVANAWLPRLGLADLKVELRDYSEKKSGGVNDAISINVYGAGGGHGYRAASTGERRRVDLAILLALSEIASASAGQVEPSTLFFDELFDSLDEEGIVAVSATLEDLAQDRCVVVITHNADLAARLPAARRFLVSEGKVKAL